MHVSVRAFLASTAVFLALAAPAAADVVINEASSQGGPDFIELKNNGAADVDISGYVLRDSGNGANNAYTIPAGTTISAGGYYSYAPTTFGLGDADSVRLFLPGAAAPVETYTWTAPAPASYGRCGDSATVTGPFVSTFGDTPGAANRCPTTGSPWPGGTAVRDVDTLGFFGEDLSGLAYQGSGTSTPGVLWAVRNGDATLFRLLWDGAKWTPDTTNGWTNGKKLSFPDGTGLPDGEGLTFGGDANAIYVSIERNDIPGQDTVSRPGILRFDTSGSATTIKATREWALAADIPLSDANAGLEGVTWVPDSVLVAKGFRDESKGADYNPASYPDHGTGLFFVGVEGTGQVLGYALNQATGAYARVATITSGFSAVMDLHFEAETNKLWVLCDDTCNGQNKRFEIAQSGADDGKFTLTDTVERPSGMPNYNNEGITIAPQSECVNGLKPVIWTDDSGTNGHALRQGTLNCTVPAATGPGTTPGGGGTPGGGTPPGSTPAGTPPVVTTPPVTPGPTPPAADKTAPSLKATLKLTSTTRRTGRFTTTLTLGEKATVTISATAKRSAKAKAATILKASARSLAKGSRTLTLTVSKKLRSKLRKGGSVTLTVVARDAAGNRTTRKVTAKVK